MKLVLLKIFISLGMIIGFVNLFSCASLKHSGSSAKGDSNSSSTESDKITGSVSEESHSTEKSNTNNNSSSDSKTSDDSTPTPTFKNTEAVVGVEFSKAIKLNDEASVVKEGAKLLSQNPKNVKVLNAFAMFYFKKGRTSLAKLYISKAIIAANEKSSEVYNNLGIIHISEGETREALIAFKRGYQINSQDPFLAANLGNIYAEAKDYRKALLALEIAYKGGVKSIPTLNNYAISLVSEGRIDDANKIYKSIVEQSSGDTKLQMNYAIFLVDQKKDFSTAQEFIDKIRFMGFSPEDRKIIDSLEIKVQSGRK